MPLVHVAISLLALGAAAAGPRVADCYTARQWTRFHAAATPTAASLQKMGSQAARAVERGAPLPWAAAAVRIALVRSRELESDKAPSLVTVYRELGEALERVAASRWRGIGLRRLVDEVRLARQRVASVPSNAERQDPR